jgi:hypothetical protein
MDNSIAGLAMVLSKSVSMNITVSGESSYISSKGDINIAAMPDTPLGKMLTSGLVMHEVSHRNHSDLTSKPSGLHGTLTNIIEDIRVEALTSKSVRVLALTLMQ